MYAVVVFIPLCIIRQMEIYYNIRSTEETVIVCT